MRLILYLMVLLSSAAGAQVIYDKDVWVDANPYARDGQCDDNRFIGYPEFYMHWPKGQFNRIDDTDCMTLFLEGHLRWRNSLTAGDFMLEPTLEEVVPVDMPAGPPKPVTQPYPEGSEALACYNTFNALFDSLEGALDYVYYHWEQSDYNDIHPAVRKMEAGLDMASWGILMALIKCDALL